jgi:hypothetical protein
MSRAIPYTSIQQALGKAVREVHPQLEEIRYHTRAGVRRILREIPANLHD